MKRFDPRRRGLLTGAAALAAYAGLSKGARAGSMLLLGAGANTSAVTPYTGLVSAGPFRFPNTANGNTSVMGKVPQLATDTITALQVFIPNFKVQDSGPTETNNGGIATVAVAIEYPVDATEATARQPCLWSGSATGTIAAGGLGLTDALTLATPIPAGATFNIWVYFSNPSGIQYYGSQSSFAVKQTGEKFQTGASNVTVTGTINDGNGSPNSAAVFPICAVIGQTTKASIIALGDSVVYGLTNDTPSRDEAVNGRVGIIGRAVPTTIAQLNIGSPSMRATAGFSTLSFASVIGQRGTLIQYASHVVNNLGINDLKDGILTGANDAAKAAALASANTTIAGASYFRAGQKKFLCTVTPDTTSTDSFVTTTNQAIVANVSPRVAYNDLVRAGVSGYDDFFEIADALESARDSTFWAVNGSAFYVTGSAGTPTTGLHPNLNGYVVNAASSQMTANLAKVHYP